GAGAAVPVDRAHPDGHVLWPAGRGARLAVSHFGALHRRLADLQHGGHRRRLADPVCGHLAGQLLRPAGRGLVSFRGRAADAAGAAAAAALGDVGAPLIRSSVSRRTPWAARCTWKTWRWARPSPMVRWS